MPTRRRCWSRLRELALGLVFLVVSVVILTRTLANLPSAMLDTQERVQNRLEWEQRD